MRRLVILFLLGGLALSSFSAQVTFSKSNKAFEAVVQLFAYFPDPAGEGLIEATGSGSIISKNGYILTNSHVVVDEYTHEKAERIEVCFFRSEFEVPGCHEVAEVVAFSSFYDLALLKPVARYNPLLRDYGPLLEDDTKIYPAVTFLTETTDAERLPSIRESVSIVGYPDATGTFQITATAGTITGYDSDQLEYIDLVTDAIINAGNSGGAAFGADDRFIGVPYANSFEGFGGQYGYIVPVTEVNGWLASLVEDGTLAKNPVEYAEELHESADELSPEYMRERIQQLEDRAQVLESENSSLQQRTGWALAGGVLLFFLLAAEWLKMQQYHEHKEL